jgi:NADH dehydrogenase
VRVTLIDKRNFNLFQPLLYQVASGLVSEADVASPLRQLLGKTPNIQILLGEVEEIDPSAKEVVFNDRRYAYDHLILATGSGSSYFGHEEWRPEAPPMKIIEHADEIRRRVLMALEEAEQTPDPERRQLLQTVLVIGGGPTGCELAGSLADLMSQPRSLVLHSDANEAIGKMTSQPKFCVTVSYGSLASGPASADYIRAALAMTLTFEARTL